MDKIILSEANLRNQAAFHHLNHSKRMKAADINASRVYALWFGTYSFFFPFNKNKKTTLRPGVKMRGVIRVWNVQTLVSFMNLWNEDTWWSDSREGGLQETRAVQQPPIPDEEGAAVELVVLFWPFPLCLWPPLLLPPPPDFGCTEERKRKTIRYLQILCISAVCNIVFNIASSVVRKL